MPVDIGMGVMAETVGEILGDRPAAPVVFGPIAAPTLDGYEPQFPAPGIYFDMPEDVYHAIPALSQSGIKKLIASPMIFWAGCAWMNPRKKERVERVHHLDGKAYHCRLLEGASAFALRFVTSPDRSQFEGLLESTSEIKHAISQCEVFDKAGTKLAIKPVTTVEEDDGKGGLLKRPARKEDWIAQLLELNPDAPIWSEIERKYIEQHAGKAFIHADAMADIEIAAAMIERDPGIAPIMKGGMAEVSLFWFCPATGAPMKARVDKMKVRGMIDLKSIANERERSIDTAIRFAIGSYKYNIQPVVYFEGAEEVRKLVRKLGDDVIHVWGEEDEIPKLERLQECREFALKWASHIEPDYWVWIFQQKGDAPITRAVDFLREGTIHEMTRQMVKDAKKKFRDFATTFGTAPWLDIAPRYAIPDEEMPRSATEV